ncbi:MAG: hypothetical protein RIR49_765 [Actinomycetota bacterium]
MVPEPEPTTAPMGTEPSEPVTTTVAAETRSSVPDPVFAFAGIDDVGRWSVVNDSVMGGVSSGESTLVDGAMVFTGELSLDNNGGFASIRSPFVDPDSVSGWGERDSLSVEVRGDGRSWAVEVRTFSDTGGWIATVTPPVDDFAVMEVPWASFAPVTRFLDPRDAPAPLDPTDIASVAFYLIDGIEAPFRLEVRSIS